MAVTATKWAELKSKTVKDLADTLTAMGLDAEIQAGAGDYSDIHTVTIRKDGQAVQFHSASMYVRIPSIDMKTVYRVTGEVAIGDEEDLRMKMIKDFDDKYDAESFIKKISRENEKSKLELKEEKIPA